MGRLRLVTLLPALILLAACAQTVPPPQPSPPGQALVTQSPLARAPLYPTDPNPLHATTPPPAGTEWQVVAQPVSEPLADGGAQRIKMRATDGETTVNLHLVVFDSRQCGIQVLDQPQPGAGGGAIAPAMRAARAVAGVNGGFFSPDFQPLGLMIAGGRKTGAIQNSKLLGGMFLSAEGQPHLIWRSEYAGESGITDLVQSGPRLVDSGAPVSGLAKSAPRARTFIATDGHHGWVIGTAGSASLGALADLLATPGLLPNRRIVRALNLDGGNSSAIWMRTGAGEEISEPGWSTVRNFIAIVPK